MLPLCGDASTTKNDEGGNCSLKIPLCRAENTFSGTQEDRSSGGHGVDQGSRSCRVHVRDMQGLKYPPGTRKVSSCHCLGSGCKHLRPEKL